MVVIVCHASVAAVVIDVFVVGSIDVTHEVFSNQLVQ
jgi:hypothetical protein